MKYICPKCNKSLNDYEVNTLWCTNCSTRFNSVTEIVDAEEAMQIEKEEEETQIRSKDMILSTTPSLEGYSIEKYIDVISEDIIFKSFWSDAIVNSLVSILDSISVSEGELSGEYSNIQRAKEYVRKKLVLRAAKLGANAIVGIDFETNISGSSLAKVSMNGTAVVVRKLS